MIRNALYTGFSLMAEGKIRRLMAASADPRQAQLEKLLRIVQANADTEFGRAHGFARVNSLEDYQAALPVSDYDDFKPYIDRLAAGAKRVLTAEEPVMFATTSGTSGARKLIPITAGYMEEFRLASIVSGYHLLKSFPQIASGVTLSVVSPAQEGCTEAGIPYGAISGQLFKQEPFLLKKYISTIPYEVFLIPDYETRYYVLLRLALSQPLSMFYTLNPSTIALLCRRLQTYAVDLIRDVRDGTVSAPTKLPEEASRAIKSLVRPDPLRASQLSTLLETGQFVPHRIWTGLKVVSCWTKAAAAFYLDDFPQYFGDIPVCDITYGASEGRGTVFMGPGKQMLALHSHFFEFIPEAQIDDAKPTVLLADQLQEGENYFILFTTSGGLYRYNINDVVKVVGYYNQTPLLEFQYKGGAVYSFTGEKITELQVVAAMTAAAAQQQVKVRFFTVIPRFYPQPHYELLVELASDLRGAASASILNELAAAFDAQLGRHNVEYATKRSSLRLEAIEGRLLAQGSYEKFRLLLTAQGVADAQIKVSHLNPKAQAAAYFEEHIVPAVASELEISQVASIQ